MNHFKNHYELTRKDLLAKNLKRLRRSVIKSGSKEDIFKVDFFPLTYVLPNDYQLFLEHFKKNSSEMGKSLWIMKPVARAQGRGIFLFSKLSQISEWKKDYKYFDKKEKKDPETYVVQKYISNPSTIGGKKYDLRLYALVVSFSPLKIWIHRKGFARFTSIKFSTEKDKINNNYIHLTNFSLQKKIIASKGNQENRKGQTLKWDVHSLRKYFMMKHGREETEILFAKIQEIIVQALISVKKTIIQDKHCFELYGFDILIDSNSKPWLIEVNASPSFTASDKEDKLLKENVIEDALDVIDFESERSGREVKIGGFDLVYDNIDYVQKQCTVTEKIASNENAEIITISYVKSKIGCNYNKNEIIEYVPE